MNKNQKIFLGITGLLMLGLIGFFLFKRKKAVSSDQGTNVIVSQPETIDVEAEVISDNTVNDIVTDVASETPEQTIVQTPAIDPNRPKWYTKELEATFNGLLDWWKGHGVDYTSWINKWPNEKWRIKNEEDYLIFTVIYDMSEGKNLITKYQAVDLSRYYGIGWDKLALQRGATAPALTEEQDFLLWSVFNIFYNERKQGSIEDCFFMAVDHLVKENIIDSKTAFKLKYAYNASKTI